MSEPDLNAVRQQIRERRERMAEVQRRRQLAATEEPGERRRLVLRCEKSHRGGKQPKVAEVHASAHGTFFYSVIPWAPTDSSHLRPWLEESHLATLFDEVRAQDDELLSNGLANLEWWRVRGPGDKSWIADRKGRAHHLLEVLDLPSTSGRLSLWVRCPLHLDDFEAVDPERLLRALR